MTRFMAVLVMALLCVSCGGGGGGGSESGMKPKAVKNLTASTTGVNAIAVVKGGSSSASAKLAAADAPAEGEVVAVDGSGSEPVFEERSVTTLNYDAGDASDTGTTLLVLNGEYAGLEDANGKTYTCWLVVVLLGAADQEPVCLVDDAGLEGYTSSIPAAVTPEGGATDGTFEGSGGAPEKVYFALNRTGGGTDIMRWNGAGSITRIETLPEGRITKFYGGRTLVAAFGLLDGDTHGHVFYGAPNWQWEYSVGHFELPPTSPVLFKDAVIFPTSEIEGAEGNRAFYIDMERGFSVGFAEEFSPTCLAPASDTDIASGSKAAYWITGDGAALCKVFEPDGFPDGLYLIALSDDTGSTTWDSIAGLGKAGFAAAVRDGSELLVQLDLDTGGPECTGGESSCPVGTDPSYDGSNQLGALSLSRVDSIKYYREGIVLEGDDTGGDPAVVYFNTAGQAVDTAATDEPVFDSIVEIK